MIIELDEIKSLLDITDTTFDTQLEALIPIIDAKVKIILKSNLNDGLNDTYKPTVAKGIWWLLIKTNTELPETFKTRSVGPLNIDMGDYNSEIDGKHGMPAWFVKAFPKQTRGF